MTTLDLMAPLQLRHLKAQGRGVLLLGAFCLAVFSPPAGYAGQTVTVPDLTNPTSIGRGKASFEKSCTICHGDGGKGGRVKPLSESTLKPDQLFSTISEGRLQGSNVMPSWKNALSDEERWQLVSYLLSIRLNASKEDATNLR